jgi:hypothetical protein
MPVVYAAAAVAVALAYLVLLFWRIAGEAPEVLLRVRRKKQFV